MIKLFLILVALAITGSAIADEQIRRIQEELRKRRLYFGEIDGRKTEQTIGALRHYQERKGFPVTGEVDELTLTSLNLAQPNAEVATWPEVPVLKSDAARQMKEEDRKYLESLDPVGEEPGADDDAPADATAGKDLQPPPKEHASPPPKDQKPPPELEAPPPKKAIPCPEDVPPQQLEEFVREYLDACETNRLSEETAFYADRVKYFDHGPVDLGFIKRDVAAFYKRWPERSYELLDFKVQEAKDGKAIVKFRISFQYRSPKHRVKGKTDNVFTIQQRGEQMKFTALKEQRLRD